MLGKTKWRTATVDLVQRVKVYECTRDLRLAGGRHSNEENWFKANYPKERQGCKNPHRNSVSSRISEIIQTLGSTCTPIFMPLRQAFVKHAQGALWLLREQANPVNRTIRVGSGCLALSLVALPLFAYIRLTQIQPTVPPQRALLFSSCTNVLGDSSMCGDDETVIQQAGGGDQSQWQSLPALWTLGISLICFRVMIFHSIGFVDLGPSYDLTKFGELPLHFRPVPTRRGALCLVWLQCATPLMIAVGSILVLIKLEASHEFMSWLVAISPFYVAAVITVAFFAAKEPLFGFVYGIVVCLAGSSAALVVLKWDGLLQWKYSSILVPLQIALYICVAAFVLLPLTKENKHDKHLLKYREVVKIGGREVGWVHHPGRARMKYMQHMGRQVMLANRFVRGASRPKQSIIGVTKR